MTRRQAPQIEITMFPFLSVLCALMGILILFMIVGAGAVGSAGWTRQVLPADECTALEEEIRQLSDRLEKQRLQCDRLRQAATELAERIAAKEDLAALGTGENAERRPGTELGLPVRVNFVPDPRQKVAKVPILMEVSADGFTLGARKQAFALAELGRQESPLTRFLRSVDDARDEQYLLLLLHDNGMPAYKSLRRHLHECYGKWVKIGSYRVRTSRIDLGVEPFHVDWSQADSPSLEQPHGTLPSP